VANTVNTFTDYTAEQQDIERRRKMAELLQQQGMQQPEAVTAGGYYVAPSWTQGLAQALKGGLGAYQQGQFKEESKALAARARSENADWLKSLGGTPEIPARPESQFDAAATGGDFWDKGTTPATDAVPAVPLSKEQYMAKIMEGASSGNPMTSSIAGPMLAKMIEPDKFGTTPHVELINGVPHNVVFSDKGNKRDLGPVSPRDKMEQVTTAGANGAPQTSWMSPFAPPANPTPQPVKLDNVSLGDRVQPTNNYTGASVGGGFKIGVSPNTTFTQQQENARFSGVSGNTAATNATTRRGQDIGANPEVQGNIAQARAFGTTSGNAAATAQINLPQIINDVSQIHNEIQQMIGDANVDDKGKITVPKGGKKPHPGFSVSVGASIQPGFQYIPGTDKSDFYALKDQVTSEAFLQAYKDSLKGGGAITEIEGVKGTQALLRARTSQSEPEFVRAMREFDAANQRIVQLQKQRATPQRRSSDVLNAADAIIRGQ